MMEDLVIKHFIVTLLLLVYIESSSPLNCYQCNDVGKVTDCQNVVSCSTDESCYTDTVGTDDNTRYTLGCRTKQICRHPYSVSQGALIGRAVTQDLVCSQCCGVDLCNHHICASSVHGLHTSQCADEPNFNCQQVSELFNVCNDQDHAKLVCRKFCDLCDIVDGYWLGWSSWSICSHTCGSGIHTRTRACNKTEGGLYCTGNNSESQQCLNTACPVDGGWTYWSSWSSCSATCGSGFIKRDRLCTNPSPGPSGQNCDGYSWDVDGCLLQSCTDGTWTAWSDWGSCSASCQGGISRRSRQCNTTALGHSCVGKDEEYKVCNTQLCSGNFINGGWSIWTSWSTCSAYCMSERTRTCSNPVPSAYGKNCVGNSKEKVNCNQEYCSHSVRLVNGSDPYEGRLEVYHNGQWGTVCNNNFTNTDADVVCRMLNYDGVPIASTSTANSQGTLPILLDNVFCTGTEESLFDCKHLSWGSYRCGHSEEVSVSCHGTTVPFVIFTNHAQAEFCMGNPYFPLWSVDFVICNTSAHDLRTINTCTDPNIHVRLVNGTSNNTGKVEVSRGDNVWGTVCDIGFDKNHAEIVCRMLSMPTNTTIIYKGGNYSIGSSAPFVTDISCSSSVSNLGKCGRFEESSSTCDHHKNVGIACVNDLHIRLANGIRPLNGRVEASVDGTTWRPICDPNFHTRDANVVCRTLGYSGNVSIAYTSARFGSGSGQPILSDLGCSGSENSLADCNFGVVSTSCQYPAGVDCVTDMNVRLVNGTRIYNGRVEVSLDGGNWGPVCDESFTSLDAKAICRTLGYSTNLTVPYIASRFGQGSSQNVLSYPECSGSESSLAECTFGGSNACSHTKDVGVDCSSSLNVRLAGGSSVRNGRVELSVDGNITWGTVCDDSFNATSARVICKMLGFPWSNAAVTDPPDGTGQILLDEVNCNGSEISIADCPHNDWGINNCGHVEDVGVSCS